MRRLPLLAISATLLSSCALADFGPCAFGGDTEEADAICAEKNFGQDGAAYIVEREMLCGVCGTTAGPEVGATEQYCALNCQ